MLTIYSDGFRMLWEYREFQIVFEVFRNALLALIGVVTLLVLLHVLFLLGYNSWLYRRRSPRPGWTKRFFGAAVVLIVLSYGIYWLAGTWVTDAL
jgi:hypothetical protein